jgi:ACR3 family arsenite efflux pump ArsB
VVVGVLVGVFVGVKVGVAVLVGVVVGVGVLVGVPLILGVGDGVFVGVTDGDTGIEHTLVIHPLLSTILMHTSDKLSKGGGVIKVYGKSASSIVV